MDIYPTHPRQNRERCPRHVSIISARRLRERVILGSEHVILTVSPTLQALFAHSAMPASSSAVPLPRRDDGVSSGQLSLFGHDRTAESMVVLVRPYRPTPLVAPHLPHSSSLADGSIDAGSRIDDIVPLPSETADSSADAPQADDESFSDERMQERIRARISKIDLSDL